MMAKVFESAPDTNFLYTKENYGIDFRDSIHLDSRINYFDTIFFHKGWLYNRYKSSARFAEYKKSKINIINKFWKPMPFIQEYGKNLILKKIESGELQEKYNVNPIPDGHHFKIPGCEFIENNTSIRFDKLEVMNDFLIIEASKVTYFDQASTNLALYKKQDVAGRDLRIYDAEIHGAGHMPRAFEDSILANSLGVACMFEVVGTPPLLVPRFRPKKTKQRGHAVMSDGAWHCSSSGVFEYKDLNLNLKEHEERLIDISFLERGIAREIESEANLMIEKDYDLVPLCISREIPRGGKPQMFYKAILNPDRFSNIDSIKKHLINAWKEEKWEYDDSRLWTVEFNEIQEELGRFGLISISDKFTYEGYANIVFAR